MVKNGDQTCFYVKFRLLSHENRQKYTYFLSQIQSIGTILSEHQTTSNLVSIERISLLLHKKHHMTTIWSYDKSPDIIYYEALSRSINKDGGDRVKVLQCVPKRTEFRGKICIEITIFCRKKNYQRKK